MSKVILNNKMTIQIQIEYLFILKQKQIKNRRFARFAERPLMKTMKNAHIAEQEYSTKNSIFD